jgi:ADP-ribosylglycohydrolase
LYCVLRHPDSFEKAVSFAVKLGGDADTIAAIAGAVAGAYHGVRAIPARWLDHVENDARGRSQMADLGGQLFSAWQARSAER